MYASLLVSFLLRELQLYALYDAAMLSAQLFPKWTTLDTLAHDFNCNVNRAVLRNEQWSCRTIRTKDIIVQVESKDPNKRRSA